MKKVKVLVLLLTLAVGGFYACTDSNPVENEVVTSKSISLRTTLNAIKKVTNPTGKSAQDQALCFQFVYPINLSYNDGTTISVTSFQGLLDVLLAENTALYIEGIEFPFQVQNEGAVTTIHNEAEFYALIQSCDFPTVNDCVFDFTCYEIQYPIHIINANQETVTIENQTELMQYAANPAGSNTSTYQLNIVFPITIIQDNQSIVVDDLYEFLDINDDCAGNSCICTADYTPVCVQTSTGIVEFSNACHAECAGYTADDFVNCNGSNPTDTFGQLLGSCFNVVYPVQVQYQGALVTIHNDGELLQYWWPNQSYFPHLVYPVTITFQTPVNTVTVVVNSEAEFQSAIDNHCN